MQNTFPACCGNCNQVRHLCTTPQACCLPETEDGEPRRQRVPEGGGLAVLLVLSVATAAIGLHVYFRLFP